MLKKLRIPRKFPEKIIGVLQEYKKVKKYKQVQSKQIRKK